MTTSAGLEGLESISPEECSSLLRSGCVGRIGFVVAGRPHVLPINYAADASGTVVFRTSANSILMAVALQPVAVEVDGLDEARRTGWSVCVHGTAREITEAEDSRAERLRHLTVIPWAPGERQRWFSVTPEQITGRRIPVSALSQDAFGWYPGVVS